MKPNAKPLPAWTPRRWAACALVSLACGLGLVGWVRASDGFPAVGFLVGVVTSSAVLSMVIALLAFVGAVNEFGGSEE